MMRLEIIFAGFGGQGVLLAGELLAKAGMMDGKQVTWVPSYGPEMRGGVANCTVIVDDEPIGSPVVSEPDIVVAFNRPSMETFEKKIKPGGVMIINSSLMENLVTRQDITVLKIPCNDIADQLGSEKVANMVALGAVISVTHVLSIELILQALDSILPARRKNLIPMNRLALERGGEHGKVLTK